MFIQKMHYPVKWLALFSFVLMAVLNWHPEDIFFYLLLLPYAVLFYLANSKNYAKPNLAILRLVAASITLLIVPAYLQIEPDPQAAIGEMVYLIFQLTVISAAEFIILFFMDNSENNKSETR